MRLFCLQVTRDIQRLPTTPVSVVLRKEYFDCPLRDSHAVHYILKREERGVCTLVHCSLATVMSCIDALVRIAVVGIRIRRIRMVLGLLDPDPDSLVRGTDPDPAPDTGTSLSS
jgi:hypothetical protein